MKMTKKILSIVLVVMMLFSVSMVATSAYTVPDGYAVADKGTNESNIDGEVYGLVGDADMNDSTNVRDATLIQKFVADLVTFDEYQKVLADVNFDGTINVKDATVIRKVIADLTVDAPVGQLIYTPVKGTDPTDPKPTDPKPTTPTTPGEQKIASDFVLHGNFFGDWGDTVLYKASADATVASAVIEVAAGSYAFVIHNVATDAWLKNGGTIENTCEGWTFSTDEAADTVFNAVGGKYTFIFDLTTLKLTVVEGEVVPTTPGGDNGDDNKDTYTIYFTKPEDWADAYIYGFYGVEGGESNGEWPAAYPGAKMNFHEKNEYGQDVYTYEVPKDIDYIKFCDGSDANRRTNNVPNADIKNGRGYYLGESVGENKWAVLFWDTIEDDITTVPTTPDGDTYTVYFIKPDDWANAYIYGFYGEEGVEANQEWPETYPGAEMTLVEGNKYSYEVPKTINYIKFTDGTKTDPNKRTENVESVNIVDGRIYEVDFSKPTANKVNSWAVKWTDPVLPDVPEIPATGDEATKDEATKDEADDPFVPNPDYDPVPENQYFLRGDAFGGWEAGTALTTAGVSIELAAGTYEFKIFDAVNEKWLKTGTDVTDTCEGWTIREGEGNSNFIASGGTYIFSLGTITENDEFKVKLTIVADLDASTPDPDPNPNPTPNPDYDPVPENQYFLSGDAFGGWEAGTALTTAGVSFELAAGTYEFKIFDAVNEKWLKTGTDVTDTCVGWTIREGEGNSNFIASGGTYTFSLGTITENEEFKVKLTVSAVLDNPTPDPDPDPTPDPNAPVVYFVNTANWAQVAAYTFNAETLGGWPGTQMTKTEDQVHGFDVYKISVPGSFEKIIFNNNNNGSQTENLDFVADKYYDAQGNMYDSLSDVPAPSGLATNIYLAGSFNGWSTSANEFMLTEAGASTSVVTLDLAAATTYEFKVVRDGQWTSAKDLTGLITSSVSGLVFSKDGAGNAKDNNTQFKTTVAGTYTFTWNDSNLDITYPAANGWMVEIDGVATLLPAGATEGVYTYEVELKPSTDGHKIQVIDATGATAVNYGNAATYTDETKYGGPPTVKPINMVKDAVDFTLKTTGGIYEFTVDTTGTVPKLQVKFIEEIDYTTPTIVYFIKPAEWDDAYIHLMNSDLSEFGEKYPGYKMTLVDEATNKYSFEVPNGVGAIKFKNSWKDSSSPVENLRTENVTNFVAGGTYSAQSKGGGKYDPVLVG